MKKITKNKIIIVSIAVLIAIVTLSTIRSKKDEEVYGRLTQEYASTQVEETPQEDTYEYNYEVSEEQLKIEKEIYKILKEHGFNDAQIAAIIGNLYVESDGLHTDIIEYGTGKGYGLAQWTDTRREALEDYAKENNKDVSDLDIQMEFLINEINSTNEFRITEYTKFQKTTDVSEATKLFCNGFQRPDSNVDHMQKRIDYANDVFHRNK